VSEAGRQAAQGAAPRLARWALPAFAGALGVAMIAEGATLPLFERYAGLGPGFMVAFVGAVLVAIAAALAWQVRSGVAFEPEEAEGVDLNTPVSRTGLGYAAFGVALPVVTMPWLGFPLGGALAYACVTRAFGSRTLGLDAAIGAVLASATWLAFTRLGVQLGPYLPFGA
jgi:putative tricarboxylic transport membrane protein